jgi:dihydroorotase
MHDNHAGINKAFMNHILIRNGLVINEGVKIGADILISGDLIDSIFDPGEGPAGYGTEVIDATGMWVLPGIIDDHVHFREPGLTHKGDINSESAAAVAGGVTSFMEMPNTLPQTISLAEWNKKNERASEVSHANYSFYLGATESNISELLDADPRYVPAIKLFMGASTGNMLVSSNAALDSIFRIKNLPLACHCEDEHIIRSNSAAYYEEYGDDIDPSFHPLIRSREACLVSSSSAVVRAQKWGAKLHLLHLSTAEETDLLTPGYNPSGKQIIGEACVHHLWFDDTYYGHKGTLIKWNPAVKKSSDREALIRAVNEGAIDIIATDHAPHTLDEKMAPYFKAPSGGPMVQHSLTVMLELCHRGELRPETVVRAMCHNPARIFGIDGRGFLRPGYKADIVIVNPDDPWMVTKDNILYKCGWSPLEGTILRSRVITTIINGIPVFEGGRLTGMRSAEMLHFNR